MISISLNSVLDNFVRLVDLPGRGLNYVGESFISPHIQNVWDKFFNPPPPSKENPATPSKRFLIKKGIHSFASYPIPLGSFLNWIGSYVTSIPSLNQILVINSFIENKPEIKKILKSAITKQSEIFKLKNKTIDTLWETIFTSNSLMSEPCFFSMARCSSMIGSVAMQFFVFNKTLSYGFQFLNEGVFPTILKHTFISLNESLGNAPFNLIMFGCYAYWAKQLGERLLVSDVKRLSHLQATFLVNSAFSHLTLNENVTIAQICSAKQKVITALTTPPFSPAFLSLFSPAPSKATTTDSSPTQSKSTKGNETRKRNSPLSQEETERLLDQLLNESGSKEGDRSPTQRSHSSLSHSRLTKRKSSLSLQSPYSATKESESESE